MKIKGYVTDVAIDMSHIRMFGTTVGFDGPGEGGKRFELDVPIVLDRPDLSSMGPQQMIMVEITKQCGWCLTFHEGITMHDCPPFDEWVFPPDIDTEPEA